MSKLPSVDNPNRHVWEGWTVEDFVEDLIPMTGYHFISLKDEKEVKQWCNDSQPYYKKRIPEVQKYFVKLWKYQNKKS